METNINNIAIVHLCAIGIIKNQDNDYVFTSNIIFDLLSSTYYPFYNEVTLPKITVINSPQDFLMKVLDLLKHICHDVIFDPLATNQHSFSKAVIQGELYILLCVAVSYPLFKYGIECKVNKVFDNEIKSANEQAIGYTEGQKKPKKGIYFEMVHILYSQATRNAKILCNGMEDEEIQIII
uniref:Uncharacterized protein n=1 Tax=Rhizophagus irregularis (strain DAOM 181602 / DAOM 197198 / MUCL 43194) TaxID=747089 RepID=U9SSU5_RHIID